MTITTKRTDDDAIQTLEITTAEGKTGYTYYYVNGNGKNTNIDRLAKKVCANPNLFALKTVRGTFTFAGKIPVKNRFAGHFGAKDIIAYNYTFISDDGATVSVERSAQCLKEDNYIAFRKAIQCMCDITWYYLASTKFTPAEIEEIDPSEYAVFPDAQQVAIDAEIELANNNTTDNVEIKVAKNGTVNNIIEEFKAQNSIVEVKPEIAETDGSEEDDELNEVWKLIPSVDALNDVAPLTLDEELEIVERIQLHHYYKQVIPARKARFARIDAEEKAKGNYSLNINGEKVIFRNHKLVKILAGNFSLEIKRGRKNFRFNGRRISANSIAENYINAQIAAEQDTFFHNFFDAHKTPYNKFFSVMISITYADGIEHYFERTFDFFNQAQAFVEQVKNIIGDTPIQIWIKRNNHSLKPLYSRNIDGSESFNLPDTDFFKNYPVDEIQARIDELELVINDNQHVLDNIIAEKKGGCCWICENLVDVCENSKKVINFYEFILHENDNLLNAPAEKQHDDNKPTEFLSIDNDGSNDEPDEDTDDELVDTPDFQHFNHDAPVESKEIISNDILLFRNGKIAEIESLKYGAWLEFHNDGIRYFTYGGYGSRYVEGKFNGDCDRWDFDDFMSILAERGAVDDNNKPAEPVNNDFSSQLEELKIQQAVAQFDYEQKKIAFLNAQKAKQDAANKLDSIERQIDELRTNAVKVLNETLITEDLILAPQMQVTNYNGDSRLTNFNQITIFTIGEKFHISCEWFPLGEYDTPEQVTLVINRLKDAIKRGDNRFKFPNVDELNHTDFKQKGLALEIS